MSQYSQFFSIIISTHEHLIILCIVKLYLLGHVTKKLPDLNLLERIQSFFFLSLELNRADWKQYKL